MTELTINASAFKARCLGLMDDLAAHRLDAVTVTKRGKPVARLTAPPVLDVEADVDDGRYPTWWGGMRDRTHVPEGFDWQTLHDIEMPEPDVDSLAKALVPGKRAA